MTISSNAYLSEYGEEMTSNASYIYSYFSAKGWTRNAICAMLGNMQRESTINPGVWQGLKEGNTKGGLGLVQWTPASKLISWCNSNGLNHLDINAQCQRIMYELQNNKQWIKTSAYNITFEEFTKSKTNIKYLTTAFLKNYERAGVSALQQRIEHAQYWYDKFYIPPQPVYPDFEPRLSEDGMNGSYYWYAGSPFYPAYGLPNCTCYAYGRFWEISDTSGNYINKPNLSTRNAINWYGNTADGYERGSTPKLGAVICFSGTGAYSSGHVGIVEEIDDNGDILTSNSDYGGRYFYTKKIYKNDGYNYASYLPFMGFIYNPYVDEPYIPEPDPDDPEPAPGKEKKKGYKFYLKNWRKINNG